MEIRSVRLSLSVGWLEFSVPFQHKHAYIRDESVSVTLSYCAKTTQPIIKLSTRTVAWTLSLLTPKILIKFNAVTPTEEYAKKGEV